MSEQLSNLQTIDESGSLIPTRNMRNCKELLRHRNGVGIVEKINRPCDDDKIV